MSQTGFLSLLTCATSGSSGDWYGSDVPDALIGDEVAANDNEYAGVLEASNVWLDWLVATNASGVASLIPAGSTINGAIVRMRYNEVAGSDSALVVQQTQVFLVKAGSVVGSSFGTTDDWTTTEVASSFGGSALLHGATFTAEEAAGSGAGVAIRLRYGSGLTPAVVRTHVIDQLEINWFYTELEEEADAGMERVRVQCA